MGYYSDVKLIVDKSAYEERLKQIIADRFEADEIEMKSDKVMLSWWSVKWYDDFEVIREIRQFIDSLEAGHEYGEDDGMEYEFMRVGEDDGDTEHLFNNDGLMWLSRTVQVDDF